MCQDVDCHQAEDLIVAYIVKASHFLHHHHIYQVLVNIIPLPLLNLPRHSLRPPLPLLLNLLPDPPLTNCHKLTKNLHVHHKVHRTNYIL